MPDTKQNSDDFFNLLAKDQKIENPFSQDEILFRDENGNLKVLKDGKVSDYKDDVDENKVLDEKKDEKIKKDKPEIKTEDSAIISKPKPIQDKSLKPLNINQEVESIIEKSGIHFSDDQTAKRFRNIIVSRLREIRDQIQTRQILLSPAESGGMGFNEKEVDRVLSIISQEFDIMSGKLRDKVSREPFSDLQAEAKVILAEPMNIPSLVFKDVVKEEKQPVEIISSSRPTKSDIRAEKSETKPLEIKSVQKPVIPKPQPVKLEEKKELKSDETVELNKEIKKETKVSDKPIFSISNVKPKIEDVKFKPKLTGPVEEIRSMTLVDFRRLGKSSGKIIENIMKKIDLLEEESFTMRIEGIKAWKECEVYKLYLGLGNQSMEQKKPVSEIIADQKNSLTEEEFEAIVELNQKLRY